MTEEKYIKRAETVKALWDLEFEQQRLKQLDVARGVRMAIDRMMQVPVIYVDRGTNEE